MAGSLYQIVYCSQNLIQGDWSEVSKQLQSILASSRKNNPPLNVTGALLYNAGSFAQVLEGPLQSIERVFEVLQRDERHSEVTVIHSGPIAERQFPEWSMAFAGDSSTDGTAEATAAFEAVFAHRPDSAHQMLEVLQGLVVSEDDYVLLNVA